MVWIKEHKRSLDLEIERVSGEIFVTKHPTPKQLTKQSQLADLKLHFDSVLALAGQIEEALAPEEDIYESEYEEF